MSETNHTPVPWHVGPHYKHDIESRQGRVAECCQMGSPLAIANAAFIVRACNAHADLCAALERLSKEVKGAIGFAGYEIRAAIGNTNVSCIEQALADADAALQRARGEG